MDYKDVKPKMRSSQLILKMCKEQGITFININRTTACKYIYNNNNYLRLASYRKNYEKSDKTGKYVNLDFSYLKELSILDMYLREILLKMTIDIEHQLKVMLLKNIELDKRQDGYEIVSHFLDFYPLVRKNLYIKRCSMYSGDLVCKYFKFDTLGNLIHIDCPVWVFIEIISFGDFLNFYKFYYNSSQYKGKVDIKILERVKSIRNACAHNNCIIYNLNSTNEIPYQKRHNNIYKFVSNNKLISPDSRALKLKNKSIYEITCVIYTYDKIITPLRKKYVFKELKDFVNNRLIHHREYFISNDLIKSSYIFISLLINYL